MGKIAEALRANLRELAQADARMLRELDGALPLMAQTEPRVAGKLADGLDRLGVKELKALCKERGFKGYTGLTKAALIQRLRGGRGPSGCEGTRQGSRHPLWPGRHRSPAGSHGGPAATDRRTGGGERSGLRLRHTLDRLKSPASIDSSGCWG